MTITPEAEKDAALWAAQRPERILLAMQGCADLARINREEDASVRSKQGYDAMIAGVDAANAASNAAAEAYRRRRRPVWTGPR